VGMVKERPVTVDHCATTCTTAVLQTLLVATYVLMKQGMDPMKTPKQRIA
jgi:hypothetical protein